MMANFKRVCLCVCFGNTVLPASSDCIWSRIEGDWVWSRISLYWICLASFRLGCTVSTCSLAGPRLCTPQFTARCVAQLFPRFVTLCRCYSVLPKPSCVTPEERNDFCSPSDFLASHRQSLFLCFGVSQKSGLVHNTIFRNVIVVAGKLMCESDVLLRLSVAQRVGDSTCNLTLV